MADNRRKILNLSITVFLAVILVFFAAALLPGTPGNSRVMINEVCPSNFSSLYDENGLHPDWAELYNKGGKDIDISGFFLSDSSAKRDKWQFPEGTVIPSKGYLIVFLDGTKNRKDPDPDAPLSVTGLILRGNLGETGTDALSLHASFKLNNKNEGLYLSSSDLLPIDSVDFPKMKYDTVWARKTDGGSSFVRMTPTPGTGNQDGVSLPPPSLKEPVFSADSGFYNEEFYLSISSPEGEIHYTLDGSVPDIDSPRYTEPVLIRDGSGRDNRFASLPQVSVELLNYIRAFRFEIPGPVDKCTVVRAAVFGRDGSISETATRTYFVGFKDKKGYDNIGIISLVSDPKGLFGHDDGIYVTGKKAEEDLLRRISESENALKYLEVNPDTPLDGSVQIEGIGLDEFTESNYMQSGTAWEREGVLTVFDKTGRVASSQNLGIRVKGHRTRNFPKKSLNLYAREIYGSDTFAQPFFSDKDRRLTLFAGGQDGLTLIRDPFITALTEGLAFESLDFSEPFQVFIDGEYWGLCRISEKTDEYFIERHFNVSKDQAVVIKNSVLSAGTDEDFADFWSFKEYVENADLSDSSEYEDFKEIADVNSIIDYFAARMYLDEGLDWPNVNTAFWKSRVKSEGNPYADSRWRMINFDNNLNIHYDSISDNTVDAVLNGNKNHKRNELFYKLMQNSDFKRSFYERYMEIERTVFDPGSSIALLESFAEEVRPYIETEYRRFYGDHYTISDFDAEIEDMKKYLTERGFYMEAYVREACLQ